MFSSEVVKFNLTLSIANFPKAEPGIKATPASFKHLVENSSPFNPVPLILGNIKKPALDSLHTMPFIFF